MATRICPDCKAQYVASVRRCIDCDVTLVEVESDQAASTAAPVDASSGGQLAYELEGWGNQLRQSLAGMLEIAGVPFVWEAGTLVVPAPFEEQVDACIAAVEGGDTGELPDDVPLVAFDIEEVTPEELDELDAVLVARQIPHSWEESGALLVAAEREDEVAELIEEVLDGDAADADDDGFALHQALDRLYVAVDKLVKDLHDAKLAGRYLEASSGIDGLGVPYGLAGDEWQVFLSAVEELDRAVTEVHPQLGSDEPDESDESEAPGGADGTEGDEDGDDGESEGESEGEPDEAHAESEEDSSPGAVAQARARALRARLRELI